MNYSMFLLTNQNINYELRYALIFYHIRFVIKLTIRKYYTPWITDPMHENIQLHALYNTSISTGLIRRTLKTTHSRFKIHVHNQNSCQVHIVTHVLNISPSHEKITNVNKQHCHSWLQTSPRIWKSLLTLNIILIYKNMNIIILL